jgi:CRISPR-associated protein Cas5t
MNKILEIKFTGWTATPRLPFILSGNAVCIPVPSYSLLLGLVGCCLGRVVKQDEVNIGFKYSFDTIAKDLETRQRLEFDGKKIKKHSKGSDAYLREFHTSPRLTLWLNRIDWKEYFQSPIGTPSLGRSQDILKIESVRTVEVSSILEGAIAGCMLPFDKNKQIGGQLVQLAESYLESEAIGGGRTAAKTKIFIAIHPDNEQMIRIDNLFQTNEKVKEAFYLHHF